MNSVRALLLDDDIWFARAFKLRFSKRFPDVEIDIRTEPDISGPYSVYFLDNDFHGQSLASRLAHQIRCVNPDALIVAVSSHLDVTTLKGLIQHDCDGACDKTSEDDMEQTFQIVGHFLDQRQQRSEVGKPSGFFQTIRSITDLLREWNTRLVRQSQ